MSGIELSVSQFEERTSKLLKAWKNAQQDEELQSLVGVDAVTIVVGDLDEAITYRKSTALQTWLLGYEFPSTIMIFLPEKVIFIASSAKAKLLKQLSGSSVPVEVVTKSKDAAANADALKAVVKQISQSQEGKRIATLPKDQFSGKTVDEWAAAVKAASEEEGRTFDEVDAAPALAKIMAPKDEEELKTHRQASRLTSHLLSHFVDRVTGYIDAEKKVTHEQLADMVERKLEKNEDETGPKDKAFWSKMKGWNETEFGLADIVYSPIIQSGGTYDLRTSAESNGKNLQPGVITASLGVRYKNYCSNVGRTICIDPHKEQEANYKFLLELQNEVLAKLTPGTPLRDVHAAAVKFIKAKKPELESHLTKNLGFASGIEFRESAYLISGKTTRTVQAGMVFNVAVGFADLKDPVKKGKTYALSLIDTVKVVPSGPAVCLTEGNKSPNDVMLFIKDEVEEVPKKSKAASPNKSAQRKSTSGAANGKVAGTKVLRTKTRNEGRELDDTLVNKIKEHQKILHAAKQEEGLKRFAGGGDGKGEDNDKVFRKFEAYKRENQLPVNKDLRIAVDHRNQALILPMYGFAVPFHVSTIKNASKTEEGEYTSLRINFITPGQIVGKKEETPFEDPNSTFIRSVTFRSTDSHRFSELHKDITELKKTATKRAAEKKEMADVIQQEKLQEIKGRRPLKLPEVFVRPGPEGKRVPGDLEIHSNGIRYTSPHRDQRIDLLFSNIKHLFFQPCEGELIVLIHVHLKAPIMIGKKKAKDVQFYREASDVQFDETGNRKRKYRYGDEDEIELEQEERKRRQALNREFKAFAEKIAEASDDRFEVDIPFRELGFQGVPHRTNVLLQPTTDCLVHLSDTPFTVVTLSEVEIAHLERVSFGVKTFDLILVFSDFTKPPLHINVIHAAQLDNVKEWLDSVEIPLSEGPVNLNWSAIMKTVNEDPKAFFEEGGWGFLGGGESDAGSEEESEEGSAFSGESDVFEDESSDEESDFSDASNDESESEASSIESGEDWDELERKAEKADRKKAEERGDLSDDDRGKKKGKGRR